MDFRVITDSYMYGVRVTAIIVNDNKLLTYKVENQNHLIGGAIEVGETSKDAIAREVKEELGLDCIVDDLMFVVENRFDYKGEFHHMIEFHYKVKCVGDTPNTTIDKDAFECEWIPLDKLSNYDVRPRFLKNELLKWNGSIRHIIIEKIDDK